MIRIQSFKSKKVFIVAGIVMGFLWITYLGMGLYFNSHFYWGTKINEVKVGGKTVTQAEKLLKETSKDYTLELKERKGETEVLKGETFHFEYQLGEQVEELKKEQGSFSWPWVSQSGEYTITQEISYDKEVLKDIVNGLDCLKEGNVEPKEEPKLEYLYGEYHVVEGKPGNKVDKIALYKEIVETILAESSSLNLEEESCYEQANYTVDERELEAVSEELNRYLKAKITYDFKDHQEVVEAELINKWLSFDKDYIVTIDQEKIKEYVLQLAAQYDTLHKQRDFTTTKGEQIKVTGGDYGWAIDAQKESTALLEAIKKGEQLTKEPIYKQTGFYRGQNDIGTTYVEINLTKQYMWFYKEGKLITEGKVVTGNLGSNHGTPEGTYDLDYKKRNAVLRGPGYAAPVSFWMPFNSGIGIHDATWRGSFGGNIYRTNGSHGCVNAPYSLAETIFNNIQTGTPIICYFDRT